MTLSKCIQLILYGIIAGYEIPRIGSRLVNPKFDENECPDIHLSPLQESALDQVLVHSPVKASENS